LNKIQTNMEYKKWLAELKNKVRTIQIKAAITVNNELLTFYWELGADIVQRQSTTNWGDNFLSELSADLMNEFPDVKKLCNWATACCPFANYPNPMGT